MSPHPAARRRTDGAKGTEERNQGGIMVNQKILDEVVTKVNELLAQSPVKDVEKNLRVMLSGVFTKLDLVTREEFEVQHEVLKRTREKLTELEERVSQLETETAPQKTASKKTTAEMSAKQRETAKKAGLSDSAENLDDLSESE
jgi:BMFP domain-containing protein YqiC